MAAYLVITVTVFDSDKFAVYARAASSLSGQFGGTTLLKGVVGEILEGEGLVGERVIILRFDDAQAAKAYMASPEYRAAAELRVGVATVTMRLIDQ